MKIEIKNRDTFAYVLVQLDPGESFVADSSTLMGFSKGIEVETRVRGGQIKSYIRGQAGASAYFLNTYTAGEVKGEILLAPRALGEVYRYPLGEREDGILVATSSFLGADQNATIDTVWRGTNPIKPNVGMQMLRCSGTGTLLVSSFGGIHTVDLSEGETYWADRGHLVGFTDRVQMRLRQLGGVRSTLMRGEEIVFEIEGPGRIYLQTRSQELFVNWLRKNTRP